MSGLKIVEPITTEEKKLLDNYRLLSVDDQKTVAEHAELILQRYQRIKAKQKPPLEFKPKGIGGHNNGKHN